MEKHFFGMLAFSAVILARYVDSRLTDRAQLLVDFKQSLIELFFEDIVKPLLRVLVSDVIFQAEPRHDSFHVFVLAHLDSLDSPWSNCDVDQEKGRVFNVVGGSYDFNGTVLSKRGFEAREAWVGISSPNSAYCFLEARHLICIFLLLKAEAANIWFKGAGS